MKEALDEAAKMWNAWETFWHAVAGLGLVGVGVMVYLGPGTLPEEVPQHRPIGIGIAVFGAVFFLALVSRGSFAVRAKRFTLFLAAGTMAGLAAFGAWREGRIVHGLHHDGVEMAMTVRSSTLDFVSGDGTWKVVLENGMTRRRLDWDQKLAVGTPMTLLTHPDHPGWTAVAHEGASYVDIADARETRGKIIGLAIGAVVAAIVALCLLMSALFGSAEPED